MSLALAYLLMILGVAGFFLQTLAQLEDGGQTFTPLGYLRQHPYRWTSMIFAASALLWMLQAAGQLHDAVSAFSIGYMCQAANETLRARANARINQGPTQ